MDDGGRQINKKKEEKRKRKDQIKGKWRQIKRWEGEGEDSY